MTAAIHIEPFGFEGQFDFTLDNAPSIRQFFQAEGLLVARGQSLTKEEQIAVLEQVGTVLVHESTLNTVSNSRPDGFLGDNDVNWHSDASYTERPMHAVSLHALRIDRPGETSTRIASGWRAFERLPERLKEQIRPLEAMHLAAVAEGTLGGRQRLVDYPEYGPRAIHPVVMTDPITGRESLYVPYTNADHIVGLSPAGSQALLDELQSYLYAPENVYEHFWQDGDVMIWSNIGCHHRRGAMPGGERTLNRVCTTDATLEMYEKSTGILREQRVNTLREQAS